MQNKEKISFVIEKCGGDSLAHVLNSLSTFRNAICIYEGKLFMKIDAFKDLSWQLLKDNQEAKLQDQTPECISQLSKLLGYEE